MGLMEDLGQLQERAAQELTTVQDTAGLEAWRVRKQAMFTGFWSSVKS